MTVKKILFFLPLLLLAASGLVFAETFSTSISVFPPPPDLTASVTFSEPSGNKVLDAEETGKLLVKISNHGKGDAFDVELDVSEAKNVDGLDYRRKVAVGNVAAGASREVEVDLKAGEEVASAAAYFKVQVKEANGFDAEPMAIAFNVKRFEPPRLVLADLAIDAGNGSARIEPMKMVEVAARIQNVGQGDARRVVVDLETGENVFIAGDGLRRFELGTLPAGKFSDIKFMFYTNKRIANGEKVPLAIKVSEAHPKFALSENLALVMNSSQKRLQETVVQELHEPKRPVEVASGLSVDVDKNIPRGKAAGAFDIAVVVGNRDYSRAGIPNVEFANRDAEVMKEYLVRALGFREENVFFELDATVSKFNELFGSETESRGKLFNYVKKGVSSVFVYYVGHGAPDLESHEAYFVPVDANPQYIATNGYKLQTFYKNLAKLSARKITVVLDSCFSGNSDRGFLFKNISPALVKVKKEHAGLGSGTLITSSAMDQVSTWYPEKRHSLFTYYFLKGLQGEADLNRDNDITMQEMRGYLQEHVPYMARRLAGTEQQPVLQGSDLEVLVSLQR